MGVRFGVTPHPAYLALSLVIPFVWVLAIFAQRGYERRFLGTGPEEYRRVADAGLLLFAGHRASRRTPSGRARPRLRVRRGAR